MKVVMSADNTDEGAHARQWCARHLVPGDAVIAVVGKRPRGPVGDVVWGEVATHIGHHPPCAVVIVPVGSHSAHPEVA